MSDTVSHDDPWSGIHKLDPSLRNYPWGSRTMLAQLRGQEFPTTRPEAELWYGAHNSGPSTIVGRSLLDIIEANPQATLGSRVMEKYGAELPFLVKLLAADEPLSLQAHPSSEQAKAGFERENRAGLALDAPDRNYKDPRHKPEILVALTEFTALAGFRPVAETRELLLALDAPPLAHYMSMLPENISDPEQEAGCLRALFTTWITIPWAARNELLEAVVSSARNYLAHDPGDTWMADALGAVVALHERYPEDIGVLGALLLNHVRLQPGEALHLEAGHLHAYLYGLGVEVMANSDNVLRGGLTSKYVDVPELVQVVNFSSLADPRITRNGADFDVDLDEFRLSEYSPVDSVRHDHDGPAIALCTAGTITVGDSLTLNPGEAAWIPAAAPAVDIRSADADSQVFIARA